MADLFKDILPSILETKKPVLTNPKDYNSFLVNRALSYHYDCLFDANEMNRLRDLDKTLQYSFYINIIRAARRPFAKWAKSVKSQDLQAVKMYFGYSDAKAHEALHVLTEDQLAIIRTKTDIGE
jgi:hypothetical protein